jgi:hypothetical protein
MAMNSSRSMNADLSEGMTDGKYKKVINDRSVAEPSSQMNRRDLYDRYYGIHETPAKVLPDGLIHPTPNYVPTAPPLPF